MENAVLSIVITPPMNLIFADIFILKPLMVNKNYSDVIDTRFLQFKYRFFAGAKCTVSSGLSVQHQHQAQIAGSLVTSDDTGLSKSHFDCREFLSSSFKYKTSSNLSIAVDYVHLQAEVEDFADDLPLVENLFLPVRISGGFPNTPPRIAVRSDHILQTDQFVLLVLSPDIISASDNETLAKDLVFNVTKPTNAEEDGHLIHVRDHWRPIQSFFQDDLFNRRIAYRPPSIAMLSRRKFEVQFVVYDGQFASSAPASLHIHVNPVETTSPKVAHNGGLIVIKGQSRPITLQNLRIIDSDNANDIEVNVRGSPLHGSLLVRGKHATMFRIMDMERGDVSYKHNGMDLFDDRILFHITDKKHTIRTRFVIKILDAENRRKPSVVANIPLSINSDDYIPITLRNINAVWSDDNDNLTFKLMSGPTHGIIYKLYDPLTIGQPVSIFTKRDLINGYIFYKHSRIEQSIAVTDAIRIGISPSFLPNENYTEVITFQANIKTFKQLLPVRKNGTRHHLVTKETEVLKITKEELFYQTDENSDEITYTITCHPYFVGNPLTLDAGRLVIAETDNLSNGYPNSTLIKTFTQTMINRGMIEYSPPTTDIGPDPVTVQFAFAVSSPRAILRDQQFMITITPVNNEKPRLIMRSLVVKQGESAPLGRSLISVVDVDTKEEDLIFTLEFLPICGRLMLNEQEMIAGNLFYLEDIRKSAMK